MRITTFGLERGVVGEFEVVEGLDVENVEANGETDEEGLREEDWQRSWTDAAGNGRECIRHGFLHHEVPRGWYPDVAEQRQDSEGFYKLRGATMFPVRQGEQVEHEAQKL